MEIAAKLAKTSIVSRSRVVSISGGESSKPINLKKARYYVCYWKCLFFVKPSQTYWVAVKRIMRYVN